MGADGFVHERFGFMVEKLEAARPAGANRNIDGQLGGRRVRPISERVPPPVRCGRRVALEAGDHTLGAFVSDMTDRRV